MQEPDTIEGEAGYLQLLRRILEKGTDKSDRTGVGTRSLFGAQLRFDLNERFPLLTTKKIHTRSMFAELAWLIRGETNIKSLNEQGVTIWDEWADENGDLGPIYGRQWRRWPAGYRAHPNGYEAEYARYIDQLQSALDLLKNDPDSRRIVVTAWNPGELAEMALSPCHALFQFEVHDGKVSCHLYQRSADSFLGVPFNIASYAGLTHVMAHLAGLEVGDLIMSFGDIHIYNNHFEQVNTQLDRHILHQPTKLHIAPDLTHLDQVKLDTFLVTDYDPHPAIKAPVAV
jgi:thymidylate synthase